MSAAPSATSIASSGSRASSSNVVIGIDFRA
jgi:hypothetical protein